MGFFRSTGLIVVCVLFFVFLVAGNSLLTLSLSLNYENVRPQVVSVGKDLINQHSGINLTEKVQENYAIMQKYCEDNSEYVFSYNGYTAVIPCEDVEQGADKIIEESLESIVYEIYYKDYGCGFWDCFSQDENEIPLFLVSEKAQDYWQGKFYLALLISVALLVAMFFLIESKQNFFVISGSLIIVSALPFAKLNSLIISGNELTSHLLNIFISEAGTVFIGGFILGIIILGVGIAWHFLNLGNFISDKIKKK